MHVRSRLRIAALAAGCALAGCQATPSVSGFDPVAMDAPRGDPPAATLDLQFVSEGAHLNALAHLAAGPGPHPTVVLLHGFPGNERNLDLAQALRRAGWNAIYFTYRGAWGSGGEFSFANALEDVAAVVATLREPAFATKHRVDPQRIVLVGHSMGGAAALLSAARLPEVRCVASLAGANLGALGAQASASEEARHGTAETFQRWGEGRIANLSGEALVSDLVANREAYTPANHAAALAVKPVLLVAGASDDVTPPATHHTPLAEAIRAQGGGRLRDTILGGDHAFSDSRIALTRSVLDWLRDGCLPQLAGG